jgi:hypothetical protein
LACSTKNAGTGVEDGHPVDEGRTEGAYLGAVLHAIARGHDPGALRQRMFAQPALQQQRIEGLLHVRSAGGHFAKEQAERLGLFGQ